MTQKVLVDLKERRQFGQAAWASGAYPDPLLNAEAVGGMKAITAMIDYMEGEEE